MTVIVKQAKPQQNFLLLKPERQLRDGDTVIFQENEKTEESVNLTYASTPAEPGIMKKYQLIGWHETDM